MSRRVFLNPGELYFGSGDVHVETLLGSCVAIVMWFPGLSTGGMCHFQLPAAAQPVPATAPLDGRYGGQAWRWLVQQASQRGLSVAQAQFKVFGAARSFSRDTSSQTLDVAAQNQAFVEGLLADQQLPVLARDLGGEGYRYIRFVLRDGAVWVRRGAALSSAMAEVKT